MDDDWSSLPLESSLENRASAQRYTSLTICGQGSFGVVYEAIDVESKDKVAIKKFLQDHRYRSRELQLMRFLKPHPNIVGLRDFFITNGTKKDEVFVNIVMDFVPDSVHRVCRHYSKKKMLMPLFLVKLYSYQLFRGLAYLHRHGICHRDIKPQNLLLCSTNGQLRLCDFGSAKKLVPTEPNVSYICSRYYRAPELSFGATCYTQAVDVWSAGCVMAEMLLGRPIFAGVSSSDQLFEIFVVLGTPTKEQVKMLNENFSAFSFPIIKAQPFASIFQKDTAADAIDLVSKCLVYEPQQRLSAIQALLHPFFDDLRDPANRELSNGIQLPPLFNFTQEELGSDVSLAAKLVPEHARSQCELFQNVPSSAQSVMTPPPTLVPS